MLAFTLFAGTALAQLPAFTATGTGSGQKNLIAQQQNITNLKQRADQEITRRVSSLNALIVKINKIKKLPSSNKTSLITQVQTEINNLNALKLKVDADTDLATLRKDVQSIVQSYRVYAFFIPQINLLIAADALSTNADNLTVLYNKLQTLVGKSRVTGTTLTNLQNLLSNMQAKITDAQSQYQAVETEVIALTPQGYPTNKTVLQDARQKLRIGTADLKSARDFGGQIIVILRGLKRPSAANCIPRPKCLDVTPRCLLAEPAGGWCTKTATGSSLDK